MIIFTLLVALVALGGVIVVGIWYVKQQKLLKGLPKLKKELEKIAKELKAQEITDQISKLRKEVIDSARISRAIKVIISRIFEAEERFAKYAKELAQRERPEEIPELLPAEAPEGQKEETQNLKTKGGKKNERRKI